MIDLQNGALSLADAKAIRRACDDAGMRLIPKMNLLGHQSGKCGGSLDGLLKAHPELDESPEKSKVRFDYCRSICPKHPDSLRIVTDLADELVEAFGADAGRKIYLCPWRYPENAQKFLAYAVAHDRGQYLGLVFTTWYSCEDIMDVLEGRGVPRYKPGSKEEKTLLSLRRNFRYLFPPARSL